MIGRTRIVKVYFDKIRPNLIFGMVGRCGGGHNTAWSDWSTAGRAARREIITEFEHGMNEICGHYSKLEKSILEQGMRDPLIVTCGWPVRKKMEHVPPEVRTLSPNKRLLLEGTTGGSRLWVAQKHNIPVPCIINDFTGSYNHGTRISTAQEAAEYFTDPPIGITLSQKLGIVIPFNPTKEGHHMKGEWREDQLVEKRAPLWVSLMNKYGYYVAGLSPHVEQILRDAGVVQPEYLKEKYLNQKPTTPGRRRL